MRIHEFGIALQVRHGSSACNAMTVAAALIADCETMQSEDMHDGPMLRGSSGSATKSRDNPPTDTPDRFLPLDEPQP